MAYRLASSVVVRLKVTNKRANAEICNICVFNGFGITISVSVSKIVLESNVTLNSSGDRLTFRSNISPPSSG